MIPIQNIYYMLSYSFSVLNEQGYKSIATEKFDNIAELMAAILVKGIATQLKRGLQKEYIFAPKKLKTPEIRHFDRLIFSYLFSSFLSLRQRLDIGRPTILK